MGGCFFLFFGYFLSAVTFRCQNITCNCVNTIERSSKDDDGFRPLYEGEKHGSLLKSGKRSQYDKRLELRQCIMNTATDYYPGLLCAQGSKCWMLLC